MTTDGRKHLHRLTRCFHRSCDALDSFGLLKNCIFLKQQTTEEKKCIRSRIRELLTLFCFFFGFEIETLLFLFVRFLLRRSRVRCEEKEEKANETSVDRRRPTSEPREKKEPLFF